MKLTALYRNKRNGNLKNMVEKDHKTKKAFAKELKANGFRVVAILTEKDIAEIKRKRHYEILTLADTTIDYVKEIL